jgi:hypothetical protein
MAVTRLLKHALEQLLEFTALVGFYAMMAGIIDVAGIPLDEGYVAEWPTAVRS